MGEKVITQFWNHLFLSSYEIPVKNDYFLIFVISNYDFVLGTWKIENWTLVIWAI